MKPPYRNSLHSKPQADRALVPFLVGRGVPEGVAHAHAPSSIWKSLVTRIEYSPEHKVSKSVSVNKQIDLYDRTLANPMAGNYLFCIAGETSDRLPLQMALRLFIAATQTKALADGKRPYWHMLTGFTKDDMRDGDPETISLRMGGPPSLLVLSNLAANSTMMKVEKARDLLSRYSHIPRILVIGGDNPIAFCSRVLFTSVNRALFFGFKSENES